MKVGIISDTHDDFEATNHAIDIFENNSVGAVIHAGDFISPPVISEFKKLTDKNVSFYGILGNNDGEKRGLENAFSYINGKLLGDEGKIEIDGLKFCIYHGQDLKKKEKIIASQKFDVFIYGHSHTKHHEIVQNKKRETIVLNPGSSHRQALTNFSDPQYFPAPSIIIFDTNTKETIFVDL